jgi:glycosyltransferase involved in cell wall biosynthesis/predicted ATP-grasp superfamily ATP-dependent carboligase
VNTVLHMIETGGPGGAETVYLELIRSLDPTRWRSIAVVPSRGWVYDQLVACGIEPIVVAERHSLDVLFYARMAGLVKRFGIDIIHSHLFGSAVRAALLSRFCGIPAIGTLHGEMDMPAKERFGSLKIAIVNRGLRRIVFVSEHLRRCYLDSVSLRSDLTVVIRNGIDVDRFSGDSDAGLRGEFGISPLEFVVGSIGNPGPAKGFDVLLEAARILKARSPGCRFVIVGDLDGGRGAELVALRQSLDLKDDVVLTGFRNDVDRALASFDVYALTSRSEGFSLAVVEAMAAGLPVIATRCGGPEEIVEDGVTGLLVENASAEAVAGAIEHLRTHSEERRCLGEAARVSARRQFSLVDSVRAYERLYDECLGEHRERSLPTPRHPAKPSILITDGEQRAALAAVRSLGRAGYRVHVCSATAHSLAGRSRYCATESRVPDPLTDPSRFVARLADIAVSVEADVLLPVSEAALLAVLPAREHFECAIPFASADSFDRICDKRQVLRMARARGIAVPVQAELGASSDDQEAVARLRFPLVVKPARSVSGPESGRIKNAVSYTHDQSELRNTLSRLPKEAYPVLVQERVVGPGIGISLLMWDGELRAAFAHRRIREKPPSGGVSVLRESIPLDQELLARSVALLRGFDWQGVAMFEYKIDAATGIPYLMEINGRLWGSLQLAIDSGVDFPVLLVRAALGVPSASIVEYPTGVRSRWEWGDADNLLAVLFHSSAALALPSGRPDRLAAIREFLRSSGFRTRPEVLRLNDPGPFIRESMNWIRGR